MGWSKKSQNKTGGGGRTVELLTPLEERITKFIGEDAVSGVQGPYVHKHAYVVLLYDTNTIIMNAIILWYTQNTIILQTTIGTSWQC